MYTEVKYAELVNNILTRVGSEFDIELMRPSAAMADSYRTGDWLYDFVGSTLDTKIWKWGIKSDPEIVSGPKWDDEQRDFERRLENKLRAAVFRLLDV